MTRCSTIGYCVFLGDCLISWRWQKHSTISKSSAKQDIILWHPPQVKSHGYSTFYKLSKLKLHSPTFIYCDNNSTLHITNNPTFHKHTKHIELDCHFICDKIQSSAIRLVSVNNKHQLIDAFTKSLPSTTLENSHYQDGCAWYSYT